MVFVKQMSPVVIFSLLWWFSCSLLDEWPAWGPLVMDLKLCDTTLAAGPCNGS